MTDSKSNGSHTDIKVPPKDYRTSPTLSFTALLNTFPSIATFSPKPIRIPAAASSITKAIMVAYYTHGFYGRLVNFDDMDGGDDSSSSDASASDACDALASVAAAVDAVDAANAANSMDTAGENQAAALI